MNNVEEIVDKIYAAYGTDSGVLFGIRERAIVSAIVKFTLKQVHKEEIELTKNEHLTS